MSSTTKPSTDTWDASFERDLAEFLRERLAGDPPPPASAIGNDAACWAENLELRAERRRIGVNTVGSHALTRAEAVAVDGLLPVADDVIEQAKADPEKAQAHIRRLRLEAAIRDGGEWWGERSPGLLDTHAKCGRGDCPEMFVLPHAACVALRELMPALLTEAVEWLEAAIADPHGAECIPGDRARLDALRAVAERLGIEQPHEATA